MVLHAVNVGFVNADQIAERAEWCEANCRGDWFYDPGTHEFDPPIVSGSSFIKYMPITVYQFESERDAFAFKMHWC